MRIIKLKIDSQDDRENLCVVLTANGYKTWVEQEKAEHVLLCYSYYVYFELTELEELVK